MPDSYATTSDDRPSWDLYRRMLESSFVSPARREATLWALAELEQRMGADWLERYWRASGHVPSEVNLGSAHVSALGNLLDFALRLNVLDTVPGVGKVQREMRNDLRDDRRRHCALQLEVGALAARAGYAVAFEDRLSPGAAPSDVVLRRDEQILRVETFAIIRDKRSQESAAYWDWLMHRILQIEWQYGTPVAGAISQQLDSADSAELIRLVERAALDTVATGKQHVVSWHGADLQVLPSDSSDDYQLQGGVEESVSWPRIASKLRQKAEQAQASGGGWLRADILDGTWQFTPWAQAGLRAKIDEIASLVRPVMSQIPNISGVIFSNGTGVAQGQFFGESARSDDESYGLRGELPAVRVRETMIVPVSTDGRRQARIWVDLYGSEDSWLDWALDRAELPSWHEIRP
jgi:hypothetical protein